MSDPQPTNESQPAVDDQVAGPDGMDYHGQPVEQPNTPDKKPDGMDYHRPSIRAGGPRYRPLMGGARAAADAALGRYLSDPSAARSQALVALDQAGADRDWATVGIAHRAL